MTPPSFRSKDKIGIIWFHGSPHNLLYGQPIEENEEKQHYLEGTAQSPGRQEFHFEEIEEQESEIHSSAFQEFV